MSGVRLLNNQNYVPVIDSASSTVTYIGYAIPGSLESNPVWQIKKLVDSGTVTKMYLADGNQNFDNIWSDRASLVYL
jgi:hypothetical protein